MLLRLTVPLKILLRQHHSFPRRKNRPYHSSWSYRKVWESPQNADRTQILQNMLAFDSKCSQSISPLLSQSSCGTNCSFWLVHCKKMHNNEIILNLAPTCWNFQNSPSVTQHQPFPMKIPNGIIHYPKFSKETLVRFDKYREPPRLPQSSIFPLQIALWTCSMHNKCITINLNPPATCRNFQSSSSNRYTNHSSRQYPKMLIQSFFF